MGEAATLVNAYLSAFYSGDLVTARRLVSDTFTFRGPFVTAPNAEAFFASAAPLGKLVRGHRLVHQWEGGGDVCTVFEMKLASPTGAGEVLAAEWHSAREGELVSGQIVFDTAAFRAIVPAR
jgi:hypothetical protein